MTSLKEIREEISKYQGRNLDCGEAVEYLMLSIQDRVNFKDFFELLNKVRELQKKLDSLNMYVQGKLSIEDSFPQLTKDKEGNVTQIITRHEIDGKPIVFKDMGEL